MTPKGATGWPTTYRESGRTRYVVFFMVNTSAGSERQFFDDFVAVRSIFWVFPADQSHGVLDRLERYKEKSPPVRAGIRKVTG